MYKRIIGDLILLAAVLYAPWWLAVGVGVLAVLFFSSFIEIIIAGILLDTLYGSGELYFTAGALLVYVIAYFLKKTIRY